MLVMLHKAGEDSRLVVEDTVVVVHHTRAAGERHTAAAEEGSLAAEDSLAEEDSLAVEDTLVVEDSLAVEEGLRRAVVPDIAAGWSSIASIWLLARRRSAIGWLLRRILALRSTILRLLRRITAAWRRIRLLAVRWLWGVWTRQLLHAHCGVPPRLTSTVLIRRLVRHSEYVWWFAGTL